MARKDNGEREAAEEALPVPDTTKIMVGEKEVSIGKARRMMALLTSEAADLREDDSSAAKSRRNEIAKILRGTQRQIDALDEEVVVEIPASASKQFPFRIGPREFWPGAHRVRGQVAQILRHMMDEHSRVENHRVIAGGNALGDSLGRELPSL